MWPTGQHNSTQAELKNRKKLIIFKESLFLTKQPYLLIARTFLEKNH